MNSVRRARIKDAIEQIYAANAAIRRIADDETEAYKNLPDSIEHSAYANSSREAVAALKEAFDNLAKAAKVLNRVTECLG